MLHAEPISRMPGDARSTATGIDDVLEVLAAESPRE